MRVVFLTHYFPPEVGAAPARIDALARGLQRRGVQVVVHTGFPHYPAGRIPAPYRNGLVRRERLDGLDVVRSLTYPVPNVGVVRRVVNHTTLAASTVATMPAVGGADAVVAETPPLFMAAAGVVHAKVRRAPLVLNVSDRWPASAVDLGALTNPRAIAVAERLERFCYRHAAAITAPTRGIVDALEALPEAAGKLVHVAPAVDLLPWAAVPDVRPRDDAPLRALYAGTLGMAQGLETLVRAAELAGPDRLELTLLGDGPDREPLAALVRERGLTNVRLVGAVGRDAVPGYYTTADVGLVPLRDRAIFRGALPTKLFEVLAAGRPCVFSGTGEAAAVLDDGGCGVTVAPEDPRALAAALVALHAAPERLRALGSNARGAASGYARGRAVDRWLELLNGLAADGRRSARAGATRRRAG